MPRGEEFFHGTIHDIPVGGHVLPAKEAGHAASEKFYQGHESQGFESPRRSQVFMADKENESWQWADKAQDTFGGRPRVYRVSPGSEPKTAHQGGLTGDATHFTTDRATVEGTEWTPPPSYYRHARWGKNDNYSFVGVTHTGGGSRASGVQSTFSPLNWHQFYDKDRGISNVTKEGQASYDQMKAEKQGGRLDLLKQAGRVGKLTGPQHLPGMEPPGVGADQATAVTKLREVGKRGREQRSWEKEMGFR